MPFVVPQFLSVRVIGLGNEQSKKWVTIGPSNKQTAMNNITIKKNDVKDKREKYMKNRMPKKMEGIETK